ncbi:MAG TPA: four helix bundle protein [Thermoanaerobaculia bacterium]|nr:four helix bundle protein [Thermoanaerobaculia bacterium]
MGDYKNLPLWKRGMSLAHTVYAAVEAAGANGTQAGIRLRKAAVSVPSLVGEAFLDSSDKAAGEALALAEAKLEEVRKLLTSEPSLKSIPPGDVEGLLADLGSLQSELAGLRASRGGETEH